MRYIKKLWKDPVLSQLISIGLIALITIGYNFAVALVNKRSFNSEFISFWMLKIDLWCVCLLLLIVYSIVHFTHKGFRYDDETLSLDRNLFDNIRNRTLLTEFMLEIKGNGFSSRPVQMDVLGAMIDFQEDNENPNFEFFNPQLNKLKAQLILDIKNFNDGISSYIFGANAIGWVSIPTEWETQYPERTKKAKATIRPLEDKLYLTYQTFISHGRNILKV